METSGSQGPEGIRPTVEFVEDLVDPNAFAHPPGRRLDELTPDELLGVALNISDKSLLLNVANVAFSKALEFLDTDIDLFEQWSRTADAIDDVYEAHIGLEEDEHPQIQAIITARTESGEPVL